MKNIMIIYRNKHASHRVYNATQSQYDSNKFSAKSFINLFSYCIGKKQNQLRFDRALHNNKIDCVYIHSEEIEIISCLKEIGIDTFEYSRTESTKILENAHKYRGNVIEYTLLQEMITKEKVKSGKQVVYYIDHNNEVRSKEIYKCEYLYYQNQLHCMSDTESELYVKKHDYLEKLLYRKVNDLNSMIEYRKNEIEQIKNKIAQNEEMILNGN